MVFSSSSPQVKAEPCTNNSSEERKFNDNNGEREEVLAKQ
jgi:hypothetical protein